MDVNEELKFLWKLKEIFFFWEGGWVGLWGGRVRGGGSVGGESGWM